MQRSLFSGVSGLTNHQLILDITANNLANISTTGYKGSRISFATALTQTRNGASAPSTSLGGINPRQVGLGVNTSSVDVDFKQGSLESTGRTFDLAIQGSGFFRLQSTTGASAYTRVGNFGFDSDDALVDLGSGMRVIGRALDSTGVPTGNASAIDISSLKSIDAKQTDTIEFQGNLSSTAGALRGTNLTSLLPLIESATGASASEGTVLKDLTVFNGAIGDPNTSLAGVFNSSMAAIPGVTPAGVNLFSTTLAAPETVGVQFTLPAADFTAAPLATGALTLTLSYTDTNGTAQSDVVTIPAADYSTRSLAARTFTINSLAQADAVNPVTLSIASTNAGPFAIPAGAALQGDYPTLHVFGTKPNGDAYAGQVSIDPWSDTVQTLITKINSVLLQGSESIGSVRFDNGQLVAQGAGDQEGFSLFLGERSPLNTNSANAIASPWTAGTGSSLYTGASVGSVVTLGTFTVTSANDPGLLNPVFTMPAVDYSASTGSLSVKTKINGKEMGSLSIPAADYSIASRTFTLPSLPHVKAGDEVTFEISGNLDLQAGNSMEVSPYTYRDNDPANLTADLFDASTGTAGVGDGIPDLFQENSTADVNAWQYRLDTNELVKWYQMRFVPQKVTSSIQVYDSVGGSHTLEAVFFRTGTRSEENGGETQRYNSWDMVVNIPPSEGAMDDNLLTGIEFDSKGRYVGNGSLGTTVRGTNLSDVNTYLGTPADDSISVNWAATGTALMRCGLGDASSTNGLTGFGSASTAAAVEQDGFASGSLDTMSVSSNGDIVGLYTNGKSKGLYRIEVNVFRNPAGLNSLGQNLWQQSSNSGDPLSRTAGEGGAGAITSGALEGSNVDIASEFTRLITAQRGFQVNARVIQTTDQVLQELAGLVR